MAQLLIFTPFNLLVWQWINAICCGLRDISVGTLASFGFAIKGRISTQDSLRDMGDYQGVCFVKVEVRILAAFFPSVNFQSVSEHWWKIVMGLLRRHMELAHCEACFVFNNLLHLEGAESTAVSREI